MFLCHPSGAGGVMFGRRTALLTAVLSLLLALLPAATFAQGGKWTSAGSMSVERENHTATLLPNGQVLVTGGVGSFDTSTSTFPVQNSAELYDPATNGWKSAGTMHSPRAYHTATLLPNGQVLVAGGLSTLSLSGSNAVTSAEIYNPANNSWTPVGSMSAIRAFHVASLLSNGEVLVAGGADNSSDIATAEIYNPSTQSWTPTASLSVARFAATASTTAGRVVVAGGAAPGQQLSGAAEAYDPATQSWSAAGTLGPGRYDHAAATLPDGRVLVAGGYNLSAQIPDSAIYNRPTNSWGAIEPMNVARADHTATTLRGGSVFVVGGGFGTPATATTEYYDSVLNRWIMSASMSQPRFNHTATLLQSGQVLVAGGSALATAELYTAPTAPAAGVTALTVSLNSTANPVAIGGGAPSSVIIADVASHGTATVTGTSVTYTPAHGYFGTDSFSYKASNPGGDVTVAVSVNVAPPMIGVAPISLANPQIGAAYDQTLQGTGGTGPYSFTIASGALPAGLSLNAVSGAVFGTPTAGGSASFTVKATDSSTGSGPFSGTQTYTVTVAAPALALAPATLPNPGAGVAYRQALTASGGTAPYSYAVTAGALPSGLSLDAATGVISGTASSGGSASFSVTATDSSTGTGPFHVTDAYTMTVTSPSGTPPTASPLSISTACDTAVSIDLANGVSGAETGVAIAANPSHGAVALAGKTVTYTPAADYCGSTDSFTYTASNAAGISAPALVTVSIAGSTVPSAKKAYVANFGDGTVSVIDTVTGTVTATVQVGGAPDAVVITPDGTSAYVGDGVSNHVTVFSAATNTVTGAVTVGAGPYGMAMSPDGSHVYVANMLGRSLSVIETATNTVANTILLGNGNSLSAPRGVAVSPDGGTIYVADDGLSQIDVIDGASATVTGSIPTGADPYAVVFSPDGRRAYVANNQSNTVTVIDTAARASITTIPVGPAPMELALSPDGARLYVDNSNAFKNPAAGSVTVISTMTDSVLATVSVGLSPDGVAVTPDGSLIYVLNTDSNTVSVISAATNAVERTVAVGKYPNGRGIFMGPGGGGAGTSALAASVLPGGRSVEVGAPATLFATVVNAGAAIAENCEIALTASAPVGLSLGYQTTNPTTNAPTGRPNSPVAIVQGGYQTFLLSFTATAPVSVAAAPLDFSCSNTAPAANMPGVDTVDLTFSASPITDIVALAATATNDGTLHLATGQPGAFAVATVNLGAAGALIASADTGSASLPLSLTLCQTNPSNGQCLSAPSSAVSLSVGQNATPTFSVFASATAPIAFAPGTSRLFVRFKDAAGAAHGSTSVAVVSQ